MQTSDAPASQRADTSVEQADIKIGRRLASQRDGGWLKDVVRKAGKLGDQEPLYVAGSVMVVAGLLAAAGGSRHHKLFGTGVAVLAAVAAADGGKRLAKCCFRRTRPHVLLEQGRYAAGVGGSGRKHEQSFPSGHVAGSLAAALAVSRDYPLAGASACAATAVMGVGRVVRAAHWPLDVAAGAVIGILAEAVTNQLVSRLHVDRLLPRPRRRWFAPT